MIYQENLGKYVEENKEEQLIRSEFTGGIWDKSEGKRNKELVCLSMHARQVTGKMINRGQL